MKHATCNDGICSVLVAFALSCCVALLSGCSTTGQHNQIGRGEYDVKLPPDTQVMSEAKITVHECARLQINATPYDRQTRWETWVDSAVGGVQGTLSSSNGIPLMTFSIQHSTEAITIELEPSDNAPALQITVNGKNVSVLPVSGE